MRETSLMSIDLAGWLDNLPVIRDHEDVIIKNPNRKLSDPSLSFLQLPTLNYGLNHRFSGLGKTLLYDNSGRRQVTEYNPVTENTVSAVPVAAPFYFGERCSTIACDQPRGLQF